MSKTKKQRTKVKRKKLKTGIVDSDIYDSKGNYIGIVGADDEAQFAADNDLIGVAHAGATADDLDLWVWWNSLLDGRPDNRIMDVDPSCLSDDETAQVQCIDSFHRQTFIVAYWDQDGSVARVEVMFDVELYERFGSEEFPSILMLRVAGDARRCE